MERRIHKISGAPHFMEKDMPKDSISKMNRDKASGSCLVIEIVKSAGVIFYLHLLMLA